MFSHIQQPNSTKKEYKEDFNIFIANLERIDQLFDEGKISPGELKELIEKNELQLKSVSSDEDDPDAINPIKTLCETIINSNLAEIVITRSKFYSAILEDWFEKQTFPLLMEGRLPDDGHDAQEDMINFAHELAVKLKINDLARISPVNVELWKEFFINKDPNVIRGREACPLVKSENGYAFPSENLLAFCVVREKLHDDDEYANNPSNKKVIGSI